MMSRPALQTGRRPARLRRLIVERAPATKAGPSPRALIGVAIWVGLGTGLVELGLTLALKPLRDPSPGFFRSSRHILWMVPVVNLAVFAACGLALAVLARRRPWRAAHLAALGLSFLAALTVLLAVRGLYPIASVVLAAGLAYRVAPELAARGRRISTIARLSGPVLGLAVVALVGLTYGREVWSGSLALSGLKPAAPGAPNVLLVVLDTVRADHLSPYGSTRDTAPNLAALARRGVCFEQARSTASWTLPSHASMFTGRWPHELSAGALGPLDGRYPTLAEAMRDAGYATAGFIANTVYCSAESGLARGFIHYEDHIITPRAILRSSALGLRVLDGLVVAAQKLIAALTSSPRLAPGNTKPFKDAATVNRQFLNWLDQRPAGRPFFAFLNLFDAHDPYVLPDGYDRHFGLKPETHADRLLLNRWWWVGKRRLSSRDVALARDAYDDCIAYIDEQLGRLWAELDRRGVLSDTLVIVTADHGEHFGEHELFGHGGSLYAPEVHVPLLIAGPKTRRIPSDVRVPETVSLRDLPATIAELAGLKTAGFPGASLARCWERPAGTGPAGTGPILSEVDNPLNVQHANGGRSPVFRGPMKALASGGWSYIRNGDGREELYDLAADPRELRDLAGLPGASPRLERFRADLERFPR